MRKQRFIAFILATIVSLGAIAQEREYTISGVVPDGMEKVYLYKSEGLSDHVYLNRGFMVLAVSIDDKKSAWLRGIKDFGTPFIQLSELKGRNSELAATYGITTIPANLLIDPQGRIIAADLRGKALTRKLESLFEQ